MKLKDIIGEKKYNIWTVEKCPNKKDYCHYHTNILREIIHNIHCVLVECPYNKYYQWCVRDDDKKNKK
jgi:hypothetical protein